MKAALRILDKILEIAAITSMGVLVLLTLFSVLSRFVLKLPIAFSEEVGRFLFIWSSYLGAAITMRRNEHIKLDLFAGKLGPMAYARLQAVVLGLVAVFCAALCVQGTKLLETAFMQTASVSRIPLGLVYLVIPFSAFCMVVYSGLLIAAGFRDARGGRR